MPATTLPFDDFDGIVAKDEVELFMEGHGDRHIGEKVLYTGHLTPYDVMYVIYCILSGSLRPFFLRHLCQADYLLHIKFQTLSHAGAIFGVGFVEDGGLA